LRQSFIDNYVVETKLRLAPDPIGRVSTCLAGREILVPVPNPLKIDLGRLDGTNPRHYMDGSRILIVSGLLLEAFKAAGVDNFQAFPVVLRDMQTERKWNNYYAFNEIGLIDAALLEECKYHVIDEGSESEDKPAWLGFNEVVLSAKKLKREPKMFRLVQSPFDQLYISEQVRVVLKRLSPPEKWGIHFSETEVK
jgi:hypothetical protein